MLTNLATVCILVHADLPGTGCVVSVSTELPMDRAS